MQDTNATNPPSDGSGLDAAAAAFETLLSGTPAKEPIKKASPSAEADAPLEDEAEALRVSDEAETQAEDGEEGSPNEASADDEATDEDGEPEDGDAEKADTYTVVVNGQEVEVSLDELKNGYSRTSDYTRKAQAVAEERRAAQAERQAIEQERQTYAQLLPALQQRLEAMAAQEPDWNRLYNEDPLEYVRQKDAWREHKEQINAARSEQGRIAQIAQQEQAQRLKSHIDQQRQLMLEAIPAWKDQKRFDADRVAIRNYGKKLGFSDEELSSASDHRAILALHKAAQYDRLMSKQNVPAQRTNAPAAIKPGSQSRVPRPVSDLSKAKQRLSRSGDIKDAAAVFDKLFS